MAWEYLWYVTTKEKVRQDSCFVDAPSREEAVQTACVKLGMYQPDWEDKLLAFQIGKVRL